MYTIATCSMLWIVVNGWSDLPIKIREYAPEIARAVQGHGERPREWLACKERLRLLVTVDGQRVIAVPD